MGLGFYTGQVIRNRRIRERNELKEDRQADQDIWQTKFDKQNEIAWKQWYDKNTILEQQKIDAEGRAAEASAAATESSRIFELDVLALKRAYELEDKDAAQAWWKDQQEILNDYAKQSAVDKQDTLKAWDNEKFERDRKARQEDLREEIGLRSKTANEQFDYQYGIKTETAKESAIAAHANEMQKLLFERVMDGKLVGTDFVAAVGSTTDSKAQILQYSAAIKALGIEDNNKVLSQLAGLNNPTVMKSAFDILQKHHQELVKSGQTGQNLIDSFREGANEYFGNLVITEPDPSKADALIKQMETVLGGPLDALVKSSIKSNVGTTGSIVAPIEPTIVEGLDPGKLGEWTDVIERNITARANTERNSISKAKTTLNEIQKTGTPDQVQTAKEVLAFITERDTKIAMGLDDAKKDDLFGLVMMYGNAGVEEIKAAEPRFETAPIPEMLKQAMEAAPIEVSSQKILRELIKYGVVKKGDKVTFINADGKKVTKTYSGK